MLRWIFTRDFLVVAAVWLTVCAVGGFLAGYMWSPG